MLIERRTLPAWRCGYGNECAASAANPSSTWRPYTATLLRGNAVPRVYFSTYRRDGFVCRRQYRSFSNAEQPHPVIARQCTRKIWSLSEPSLQNLRKVRSRSRPGRKSASTVGSKFGCRNDTNNARTAILVGLALTGSRQCFPRGTCN